MSDTTPIPEDAADNAMDAVPSPAALPRPRIRVGALLWGLLLVAAASTVLWVAATPARRAEALDAVLGLGPLGATVVLLVAIGGAITLLSLAAVIRRAQHRLASRG